MKKYFAILIAAFLLSTFFGCTEQAIKDNSEETINFETTAYLNFAETVKPETTTPINSEEIHHETEFEITDWTFEDFVSDVEINGVKLSLPCSYEELSKLPDLQKRENAIDNYYDEEAGKHFYLYTYEIRTKDNLFLAADYWSENGDGAPEAEDMTDFFVAKTLTGDNDFLFRFGEINNYSNMTQNDVETILGKSNDDIDVNSWYWFGDKKIIVINYDKNDCVDYVHCFWKENNQ